MRLTRIRAADARLGDAVAAVLLVAALVAVTAARGGSLGVAGTVAGAAACCTVALRRVWPIAVTAAAMGAAGWFQYADRGGGAAAGVVSAALVLDFYLAGRVAGRRWWRSWEALLAVAAVAVIASGPDRWDLPTVASVWAFFVVLPFAAGRVVDARQRMALQLGAEASRLEAEQRQRAQAVAADERARAAREVHDVLAHSLSVMVIQTAAARRIAVSDLDGARSALLAVEACGRDALADLARMVGVMRRADVPVTASPAPGLSQVASLAERARAAGLPVELRVTGRERRVPPAVDLVSYRIVQEALTNCLKHAGAAQATVTVEFTAEDLHVEITDNGRGGTGDGTSRDGPGHGLLGMRERAALCGGTLQAGPRRGRGYRVRAVIPLTEAAGP